MLKKKNFLTLLLTKESAEHVEDLNISLEITLFFTRYSFILNDNATEGEILKRDFYPHGKKFSQNSNGARYLDPKYSRWMSTDPALGEYVPQAPINDEAKKHNENLPGMGGLFNTVNLSLYHYAGNNPVRYVDPDGRLLINNVAAGTLSAKEYEQTHELRAIAFSIYILESDGSPRIPINNTSIVLEKGLNKSLSKAYQYKDSSNYNVDIIASAKQTDNGNYQISINVSITHYDLNGKLVIDESNSGVIAFADSSELGGIGFNSNVKQELVNKKANEVINLVLNIKNANIKEVEK